MKCGECGAENFDTAQRCLECGSTLKGAADAGQPVSDQPKPGNGVWVGVIAAAAGLLLVVAALSATSGGGGGGGAPVGVTTASVDASGAVDLSSRPKSSEVASVTNSDLGKFAAADYSGHYEGLSTGDKAAVSRSEWETRCAEVVAIAGPLKSYSIIEVEYLDAAKSIVVVTLDLGYANAPKPIRTEAYYINESGKWVQSMLWDRQILESRTAVQ
ncbi:MAG: zinc ribbon domain-containing protein [Coriobacteriia bacterium]|nr:zinc ribbon domain-containing protein [Coriobacteriia bacterium]